MQKTGIRQSVDVIKVALHGRRHQDNDAHDEYYKITNLMQLQVAMMR